MLARRRSARFYSNYYYNDMQLTEDQRQTAKANIQQSVFGGLHVMDFFNGEAMMDKVIDAVASALLAEPEQPKTWRPGIRECYYHIDGKGEIDECVNRHAETGDAHANAFNAFRTREQAEAVAKQQKAERQLIAIADVVNEGWVPDWKNDSQRKWVLLRGDGGRWKPDTIFYARSSTIGFRSEEAALKAIEMMGSDLDNLLLQQ